MLKIVRLHLEKLLPWVFVQNQLSFDDLTLPDNLTSET